MQLENKPSYVLHVDSAANLDVFEKNVNITKYSACLLPSHSPPHTGRLLAGGPTPLLTAAAFTDRS